MDQIYFFIMGVPILVAGAMLVVWISNQISRYGVGNGSSIVIFANIVSGGSSSLGNFYQMLSDGVLQPKYLIAVVFFLAYLLLTVVYVESITRNIAVRYLGAKGKNVTHNLPLKINNAGVIPPVLASSLVYFPQVFVGLLEKIGFQTDFINRWLAYLSYGSPFYYVFSGLLLFWLTITNSEVAFDPNDIAKNLQDNGAVVLGQRPGKTTTEFLSNTIKKLNILAAIYLVIVCTLSEYLCSLLNRAAGVHLLYMSGTSVLITISVSQLIFKAIKQSYYGDLIKEMRVE